MLFVSYFTPVSSQNGYFSNSEGILVTGFEPWASHEYNPSQLVAQELNGSVFNEKTVYSVVLPVDFDGALKKLDKVIREKEPTLIICLGLAPGTMVIKVESIGFNLFYDPYIDSFFDAIRRVNSSGPPFLVSTIKIRESVAALIEADIPSEQSFFAGSYLCNAVLYQSVYLVQHQGIDTMVGFVHLPQIDTNGEHSWQLSELTKAITRIIQVNS